MTGSSAPLALTLGEPAGIGMEQGVGRERAGGGDAKCGERRHGGAHHLCILTAEGAVLARMGVEAREGKARLGEAEAGRHVTGDDAPGLH